MATIYKKGDYRPRVSCNFYVTEKHPDGSRPSTGINAATDWEYNIFDFAQYDITLDPLPTTGIIIGFIPAGEYTLHQVEAQNGYTTAADQTITVTDSMQAGDMQVFELVNPKSGQHQHTFSTEWTKNESHHWHAATCGKKSDVSAHNWKWIVDKEASASAAGTKHEECTICGSKRAAVEIPATGTAAAPAKPEKPANKVPNNVSQTADNSNVVLWGILSMISLIGAVCVVVIGKKKKPD